MRYLPFTHASHFLRERDFGQKIEASFDFVKAHFKPLGKALLYIVLPVALITGILSAMMMLQWVGLMQGMQRTEQTISGKATTISTVSSIYSNMFLSPAYLGTVLGGLILITVLILTVYGYLTLRLETEPDQEVSVSDVWRLVRQRFFGTLLALLGLGILLVVGFVVVSMVVGFLSAMLIAGSGGNTLMVGFSVMLVSTLLFGSITYISVTLSLFLIIWVRERLGFFASIGRSFRLIWGKWWSTFGLMMVMTIICGVILIAVMLLTSLIGSPFALISGGNLEGVARIGFVVATLIQSLVSLAVYPLLFMALAFQYFNLVERKDGESLHLLVDAIGQPAPETVPQALRPDDEGEY
ncbi:hypothetical protein SAMN06265337_2539 [Hymenobacter gelipurpurascens]|uniref:Membrane domain of glycerophosphoryl diester phosphodiesterase n=1 Tax=Hymenobacter gelipurpurascens TaxID=89968 RepID=A0A212U921_9BACT|nr:hypothetical protein [Hymenobacter gelipurpurascens]SNC74772.1 hypothetical protein SAMN06265337_2539 [Hymenobacter gelipurpurascens]